MAKKSTVSFQPSLNTVAKLYTINATGTRHQSKSTRYMLQVNVISQHKPGVTCKYTSSVNKNQTYATGTCRQST